ncbi:MAG TPA: hypothetical protein VN381_05795 [Anaerovoracaceae bacterium]|nr:hypothetical protein [Anaerovoracaceae bacterium]
MARIRKRTIGTRLSLALSIAQSIASGIDGDKGYVSGAAASPATIILEEGFDKY